MIMKTGIVPQVVKFLRTTKLQILISAPRAIGNIVPETDEQIQIVINSGALLSFPVC